MSSIRSILSASLLLTLLVPCILAYPPETQWEDKEDHEAFQKLLDQADPPSLHEALHSFSPKKFKHGMFQEDRTAVEVIHKEEPSIATSIVNIARRQKIEVVDLAKRAGDISNGTVPTTTPAAVNPQSTTTRPTPVAPISEPSTPVGPVTETSSSSAGNSPITTTSTSTSSNPASVPSSTSPATTSAQAAATTTSPSISLTAGEVITMTNGVGLVVISTVGGGASTISPTGSPTSTNTHTSDQTSVVMQTSTLPNGSKSVVTAVTVVGGSNQAADTPTGTAGVGGTTSSSSPGLQTGEAVMTRGWGKELVLVVGGAVAFAGMM